MKKIICYFKGHLWGKMKPEKGWTIDMYPNLATVTSKVTCKRCGKVEYWAISTVN